MATLLEQLGFYENPFANYVAENEPNIDQYLVKPPYYTTVRDRGLTSKSFILFGARGAGKSATRLALHKEAWQSVGNNHKQPLVVTLDSYAAVLANGLEGISIRPYLLELGYLVVESVLVWLSALADDDRQLFLEGLDTSEKQLALSVIDRFYLCRPEDTRAITGRQALRLLDQAWPARTALWAQKKWNAIAGLLAVLANRFASAKTKVELGVDKSLEAILAAPEQTWNEAHFSRAVLQRLVDFAKAFGFAGVTVLLDKADETDQTNNSAKSTAKLVYPLLANTQLLEVEDLGWVFFLWDRVKSEFSADGEMPVRLDKIANAEISWNAAYLRDMIDQRLSYFSGSKVKTLSDMFDDAGQASLALNNIIDSSMNSPRELIRVLDTVVAHHNERFAGKEPPPLDMTSVDAALDSYAIDAAKRIFTRADLQQILRLGMVTFVNTDVQQHFRVNAATARNRIGKWRDAGIIDQTGSRPAEGGSGGKPAYEFGIIDLRVRRLVQRDLSLGVDYEIDEED